MDIHNKPINERYEWLLELDRRYSVAFTSPEMFLARERYLAQHPSDIVVLKCMDGRINIPIATNTPPGIITPIRNLGGMFNLGWPHLGEVLANHVHGVVSAGRRVLILITYHFSKGDKQRGCAGFGYNTEAAIAHTYGIKKQVEHVFGHGHGTVYPIVCGFETDDDALILHGETGELLDVGKLTQRDMETLELRLEKLFPDMPGQVRRDLLPLIHGNKAHVADIKLTSRALDIEHREWMMCVGRGFDFLHMPNLALIIGPYSPDLADPIRKAASIIEANMKAGRIPDDGFLLVSSSPYSELGVDRARAQLKASFLAKFAANVIHEEFPNLAGKMTVHTAVLNWHSRALESVS
ncbi:MAG: carboxysome shell carbonic anhydrase [Polaromonas sp.]|jgi:hypothetical protein|uniref:carboxysome shell carbonic anhydrase domain-containg protein n=1 Tax=Polaromonas sp. TaxID=1869339 RepID=UPI0027245D64|nr:carboxysome shell carbonic anhydrase domain-containg protein [Polaromonas sp.]MDO9189112.1 carboxysome shell carbonic anhydrase [Sulfurimicrobium sp.]MDO9114438.1 carboxysome shell carbonic anhydrase [Polaromonas sp.]MDP2199510.1 carboxysome shell carbonic anhydrase [Sulfurimicrobium sp.]MDP2961694.1 carboxysome shell carbonic anhydrase [Sulfurimicrobium sp.]MDP3687890.1 carboxysome shell carbonic anhydrase [Sulfurimicrobium sp.]